jgi:hypothetical protein
MAPLFLRAGRKRVIGELPIRTRQIFAAESPHRRSSRPRSPRGGEGKIFESGEIVRETGIYEVLHDREHRPAHEVVMLGRDTFPRCETCEARVRFRLLRPAPYIFQDEDFENPKQ